MNAQRYGCVLINSVTKKKGGRGHKVQAQKIMTYYLSISLPDRRCEVAENEI
jgi:hypothetical protein